MPKLIRPALACLAALLIAGCSNTGTSFDFKASLKSLVPAKKSAPAAPAQVNLTAVLQQTAPTPVVQVKLGGSNSVSALMLQIETNRGYRTYATASRQTITFRNGMITATRGLGNDLMASVTGDSLALISGRRSGTSTRAMEHLNGAGETIRQTFSCETFITGSGQVKQGTLSAATTEVTENCVAGATKFTNVYQVDRSRLIVSSTQWIGAGLGYAEVKVLRR